MKKSFLMLLALSIASGSFASQAFAIKPIQDVWNAKYTESEDQAELKTLAGEAKCNVCHVEKEDKKKVRNPYGNALHEAIEKNGFSVGDFKKKAKDEKMIEQLKEIMTKIEEEKAADGETFKARMAAGKLPGGNKEGK